MADNSRPCAQIIFSKTGWVRYVGHLDMARAFDRAVRRANLPVAYSEGFNPRAKLGFSPPLSLGVESLAEHCLMELAGPISAEELEARLAPQLPPGIEISQVTFLQRGRRSPLADLSKADYVVGIYAPDLNLDALNIVIAELFSASELPCKRRVKDGIKIVDIRPGLFELAVGNDAECTFHMTLHAGEGGSVRPQEVVDLLGERLGILLTITRIVRTALQ